MAKWHTDLHQRHRVNDPNNVHTSEELHAFPMDRDIYCNTLQEHLEQSTEKTQDWIASNTTFIKHSQQLHLNAATENTKLITHGPGQGKG